MPQKLWKCDYCNETFPTKQECIEHELSHVETVPCKHLGRHPDEAICKVVTKDDAITFAFEWKRNNRTVTSKFEFNKETIGLL